jgi:Ca2+-binding EF-hand superfamily protein
LAIAVVLLSGFSLAFARVGPPDRPRQNGDVQDLVFLGDARPVLIRLHVRLDGKTIDQAWDDFVKYLFAYLDVNGDGFLDTVEAERVPSLEQIQAGVIGAFQPRRRAGGRAPSGNKMEMTKDKASAKGKANKKGEATNKADPDQKSNKRTDKPTVPDSAKDAKKPSPLAEAREKVNKQSAPPDFKAPDAAKKEPAPKTPAPAVVEPSMLSELDTNKDGKVSLDELTAYYRKSGFKPFRVHLATPQANPLAQIGYMRGGGEPSAEQISDAIFSLLDTNRDGKLTRHELAAAPAILLRLDEDEDEMITTRELVPNTRSVTSMFAGMMGRSKGPNPNESRKTLIPLARPGDVPADLVKAIQQRYGPKSKKADETKLTCKELGLDEETFRQLDTNGDGMLDGKELAGFVNRRPDVELIIRLGERQEGQSAVQVPAAKGRPMTLSGNLSVKDGVALLDLGVTRAEVRPSNEQVQMEFFVNLIRQQLVALFKAADKGNKGYITKEDIKNGPQAQFETLFPLADRDNDGKLTEKELNTFFDKLVELQERAMSSSVTLVLSFDSRGLFDLLDTNGDNRLGLREMRGAVGLLEKFDRQKKGYLTKADIPRTAKLTLRRGPTGEDNARLAAFAAIYGGANSAKSERVLTAGPLWFRKMDRNRDGDVSRKEWIFSEELFRKIDTDGDGLISVEEAERYEAIRKKEK